MSARPRSTSKIVTAITIGAAALGIAPAVAEAQSRGIMQVSASVVSTDQAVRSLDAARAAASRVVRPAGITSHETAPTVARVSVARDSHNVVVTIDYSRS